MARSYQGIAVAAGCPVSLAEMLKITFVANSMNYLVATGGLSGFAVRMYFFTRLGMASQTAVVVSLAQTFLTNVTLLAFVLVGFAYVFCQPHPAGLGAGRHHRSCWCSPIVAAAFAGSAPAPSRACAAARCSGSRRARTGSCTACSRTAPRRARTSGATSSTSTAASPSCSRASAPCWRRWSTSSLDWFLTILILYTSFLTVRYWIEFAEVIVGFAVGIVLSFASLIPGGLGVMEGSMAAVFSSMGVPFETAVVAVLLFRVAYYLLPLLISLFFLHGMFVQGTTPEQGAGARITRAPSSRAAAPRAERCGALARRSADAGGAARAGDRGAGIDRHQREQRVHQPRRQPAEPDRVVADQDADQHVVADAAEVADAAADQRRRRAAAAQRVDDVDGERRGDRRRHPPRRRRPSAT